MTYFIKIENGMPVGHPIVQENMEQVLPHLKDKQEIIYSDVEPFGFGIFDFASPPECERYQKPVELPPKRSKNGIWRQEWGVTAMSAEEIAEVDKQKEIEVRYARNKKLAFSDWTQLPDSPVDMLLWREYRQKLRDIPQQTNFPWDVEWPISP